MGLRPHDLVLNLSTNHFQVMGKLDDLLDPIISVRALSPTRVFRNVMSHVAQKPTDVVKESTQALSRYSGYL